MFAGVFSALGMLVAPVTREMSLTHLIRLDEADEHDLNRCFSNSSLRGLAEMREEGIAPDKLIIRRSMVEISGAIDALVSPGDAKRQHFPVFMKRTGCVMVIV